MKLTPWFPAGVKPARAGVYQMESHFPHRNIFHMRWNGEDWVSPHYGIVFLKANMCRWRGLANDPKESQ